MVKLNQGNQVMVRVDIYGTGENRDMWEGLILNKDKKEFQKIYEEYPLGGTLKEPVSFEKYLNDNNVEFQTLEFAIDHLERM